MSGSEDYLLGFNYQEKIGLSVELIDWLYSISPLRLAQYIYHECVPEKGISPDREDHRIIYREIHSAVFGNNEVVAMGSNLRVFIFNNTKTTSPKKLA